MNETQLAIGLAMIPDDVVDGHKKGAVALYNRLSIDYDLPLDVAKAIVHSATCLTSYIHKAFHEKNYSNQVAMTAALFGPYRTLAPVLGIPVERLEAAIREASAEYMKMLLASAKKMGVAPPPGQETTILPEGPK